MVLTHYYVLAIIIKGGGNVANTIAPFSALNLYQTQPVGGVTRKASAATSGQDEFAGEQRIQGKIQQNLVMARANAKSAQLGLFSARSNPAQTMQNLLQAQYLPQQASDNMAQLAPASAQTKLNLYKNLGADQQNFSNPIYDLLKA